MRPVHTFVAVILGCHLAFSTMAEGIKFYRYYDAQGRVVIDDNIPPDMVERGYEILDVYGRIIEAVPGVGSPDEQRKRRIQVEQDNYDRALLRRYSSAVDVEAARDRYLRELSIRIDTLEATLASAKAQLSSTEASLVKMSPQDEQRPLYAKNAQLLKAEIAEVERQLLDRKKERASSQERFAKELERLKELKAAEAAHRGLSEHRR
ncbi:MAG TPA: hypothetical protein VLA24_03270 [Pseudomonadales bacterium]|nr:hypothetical protein [Pseudomonadales bacterium]